MSGSNKKLLSSWQLKQMRILDPILVTREFQRDLIHARLNIGSGGNSLIEAGRLALKHRLPVSCTLFVNHLILTHELDHDLLQPPVSILSHSHRTLSPSSDPISRYAMYMRSLEQREESQTQLIISPDATQAEVIDFIKKKWREIIIATAPKKRVKSQNYAARNDKIYEDSKKKLVSEIVKDFENRGHHLTEPYIRQIIRREKKRRNL